MYDGSSQKLMMVFVAALALFDAVVLATDMARSKLTSGINREQVSVIVPSEFSEYIVALEDAMQSTKSGPQSGWIDWIKYLAHLAVTWRTVVEQELPLENPCENGFTR